MPLQEEIISAFPQLQEKLQQPRANRVLLAVERSQFKTILDYLIKRQNFTILHTITGLDEGENFGLIYHLGQENKVVLNLKISLPKNEPWPTITAVFPNAEIYEREIIDLLGAKITGLPDANRYPLTDDWPAGEYPLRKDWPGLKTGEKANG